MTTRAPRAWLDICLGFPLVLACSTPLDVVPTGASNRCEADDDCGPSGRCREALCVAREGDLGAVVLEIALPSRSPVSPATTHYALVPASLTTGEADHYHSDYDLGLGRPVSAMVRLVATGLSPACAGLAGPDGTVPIRVELLATHLPIDHDSDGAPDALPRGIPNALYTAASTLVSTPAGHEARVDVPDGFYDVYLAPVLPPGADDLATCLLPPLLLSGQRLHGAEVTIEATIDAETPGVQGTIDGFDLDGWTLDIIDNRRGRLLALPQMLTATAQTEEIAFEVPYARENEAYGAEPVLRLRPPDADAELGMPTLFWSLAGVPGETKRLHASALASAAPIRLGGHVIDDAAQAVPAMATIHGSGAFALPSFGSTVLFRRTIHTDGAGHFDNLYVLPSDDAQHHYTVTVTPLRADQLAVTTQTIHVSSGHLGGITLNVARKRPLSGTVVDPRGAPGGLVEASLEPLVYTAGSYLQASRLDPPPPLTTSARADLDGRFTIAADTGDFHLFLRPSPASALPWSVLLRQQVRADGAPANLALTLPYPIVLTGAVRIATDGDGGAAAIEGALIRAWVLVPPTPEEAADFLTPAAIPIGEAVSGPEGRYFLLLPPSLRTGLAP
jgi:hypothetical protein